MSGLKIRRTLLSVTDKTGIEALGKALAQAGSELVATGKTAEVLKAAGLTVISVESLTGQPEAFGGRMKTLDFGLLSAILYRRSNPEDIRDLEHLKFKPIDCVVVNFYDFEKAVSESKSEDVPIESIDIGGPTLVRAAAKNSPDVLVLTNATQYSEVIRALESGGTVSSPLVEEYAHEAWEYVATYDRAILAAFRGQHSQALRYGENPHQSAHVEFEKHGALDWGAQAAGLTDTALSYTNIADCICGHELVANWLKATPVPGQGSAVAIVKHANPCGFAWVPPEVAVQGSSRQMLALLRAWEGDPVSAFGGVLVFSEALEPDTVEWLSERYIECVSAPGLTRAILQPILSKRKRLKAVNVRSFELSKRERAQDLGSARLVQIPDLEIPNQSEWKFVTERKPPAESDRNLLFLFGVLVCRALKSNAIAIVREWNGVFQLVGAGQGQPNRVDALSRLAIPRAHDVLRQSGGRMEDCVLVSDAFFPFRDSIEAAAVTGIRWIIQPGGSIQDADVIAACDEHKVAMLVTGQRHFRH